VRFEQFERQAREEWERIPVEYKEGIDGLTVVREARRHAHTPDVYTLGECVTEAYPSEFGGPETIRSSVVLYYGSFLRLAKLDDAFAWEEEIWETLTHELKHHLESLADEDALLDIDYAMDESFKRQEGEEFDPSFYRAGEPLGDGRFRLERSVFVERTAPEGGGVLEFEVDDVAYRIRVQHAPADVTFVTVTGDVDPELDELCVVLVRPRGFGRTLRSLFRARLPEVAETEAEVERTSA
jgi:hypothetical protein